jgi:predicted anti-sigma-YlaC factor YlaD
MDSGVYLSNRGENLEMMTCQQVVDEFLTDYLEGRLGFAERVRFGLHLAICSQCRNYLESYRKTVELSRAAGSEPDPASASEIPEELVKAILAARGDGRPKAGS